jgi:general secretion pathway protein B
MSLILDALRKAEADRQRGTLPGLHEAVAAGPPAGPAAASRGGRRLGGLLAAGAALAALLVAAGWAAWPRPDGAPAAAVLPSPAPAPALASLPPAPAAAPPAPAPLPQVVSAPPPPPPPAPPPAMAAAATPGPIITRVQRLAALPPELRQQLPPLVVGGSVWSEQASVRFVVLDGQVLREGDSLAPGLVVLKLAPRAATLRWRDTLVEVPY